MSKRVDAYRRSAEQCEAASARVLDPDIRSAYVDMAARWRKMAEQQETVDEALRERGSTLPTK